MVDARMKRIPFEMVASIVNRVNIDCGNIQYFTKDVEASERAREKPKQNTKQMFR